VEDVRGLVVDQDGLGTSVSPASLSGNRLSTDVRITLLRGRKKVKRQMSNAPLGSFTSRMSPSSHATWAPEARTGVVP
jgi:hypothetical protein